MTTFSESDSLKSRCIKVLRCFDEFLYLKESRISSNLKITNQNVLQKILQICLIL